MKELIIYKCPIYGNMAVYAYCNLHGLWAKEHPQHH